MQYQYFDFQFPGENSLISCVLHCFTLLLLLLVVANVQQLLVQLGLDGSKWMTKVLIVAASCCHDGSQHG